MGVVIEDRHSVALGEAAQGRFTGRDDGGHLIGDRIVAKGGLQGGHADQGLGHGLGGAAGLGDGQEAAAREIEAVEQAGELAGIDIVHEIKPRQHIGGGQAARVCPPRLEPPAPSTTTWPKRSR